MSGVTGLGKRDRQTGTQLSMAGADVGNLSPPQVERFAVRKGVIDTAVVGMIKLAFMTEGARYLKSTHFQTLMSKSDGLGAEGLAKAICDILIIDNDSLLRDFAEVPNANLFRGAAVKALFAVGEEGQKRALDLLTEGLEPERWGGSYLYRSIVLNFLNSTIAIMISPELGPRLIRAALAENNTDFDINCMCLLEGLYDLRHIREVLNSETLGRLRLDVPSMLARLVKALQPSSLERAGCLGRLLGVVSEEDQSKIEELLCVGDPACVYAAATACLEIGESGKGFEGRLKEHREKPYSERIRHRITQALQVINGEIPEMDLVNP